MQKFIRNIDRVSKIINHLRLFGRKETAMDQSSLFDVNVSITNARELVQGQLYDHNVNVELDLEKNLPEIPGDGNSLEQVFINLFLNAIDALAGSSNNYKFVKVTSRFEQESRHIIIKFFNNGPKIEENIIGKIFEPFFTTKPPGKGTGLGLSISYGIVNSHKGTIYALNATDGLVFIIILPVP